MGISCPRCKNGKLTFFDGSFEHEPLWACSNCNYETEELKEE